jgi:hypothetical protein
MTALLPCDEKNEKNNERVYASVPKHHHSHPPPPHPHHRWTASALRLQRKRSKYHLGGLRTCNAAQSCGMEGRR